MAIFVITRLDRVNQNDVCCNDERITYLLASKKNGPLYAGVTNDPARRMFEHKEQTSKGFTARYGVHMLVWYKEFPDIRDAIAREKRLKKWPRRWKLDLINKMNPDWEDLTNHFF